LSRASGAAANRALRRRPKPRSEPRHHDVRHRLTTPPGCRSASLPASHHCRPAGSKRTCYTVDHANIAPSAAAAATNSLPRSSVRRRPRQPAHPLPKPPPRQIPINGNRPPNAPRVPSWETFGRRPSARADSHERPASETLHHSRPSTGSIARSPRVVSRLSVALYPMTRRKRPSAGASDGAEPDHFREYGWRLRVISGMKCASH
jgi:hypothetical protein